MVPCGTDVGTIGAIPIPWCPVAQRRAIPIPWCPVAQRRVHPNPIVRVCGKSLPASSCWCRTSCTSRHPAVNRALYKLFFHPALSSTTMSQCCSTLLYKLYLCPKLSSTTIAQQDPCTNPTCPALRIQQQCLIN